MHCYRPKSGVSPSNFQVPNLECRFLVARYTTWQGWRYQHAKLFLILADLEIRFLYSLISLRPSSKYKSNLRTMDENLPHSGTTRMGAWMTNIMCDIQLRSKYITSTVWLARLTIHIWINKALNYQSGATTSPLFWLGGIGQ